MRPLRRRGFTWNIAGKRKEISHGREHADGTVVFEAACQEAGSGAREPDPDHTGADCAATWCVGAAPPAGVCGGEGAAAGDVWRRRGSWRVGNGLGWICGGRSWSRDGITRICDGRTWTCDGRAWICDGRAWICDGRAWICDGLTWIRGGFTKPCDGRTWIRDWFTELRCGFTGHYEGLRWRGARCGPERGTFRQP